MKRSQDVGMRVILTTLTLGAVVATIVVVAVVMAWSSRITVSDMSERLGLEVAARIVGHVEAFLDSVETNNEANARLVRAGELDAGDERRLGAFFRSQVPLLASASSLYFGNARGGIVGAGLEVAGPYSLNTTGFSAGTFRKHQTDADGNRLRLLTELPDFDARTRSWYAAAVEAETTVWTEAYVLFTGHDMAVAASRAAFDATGTFVGVFGVDVLLSQLSAFLRGLTSGTSGTKFIVDRNGYLIASSEPEPLFATNGGAGEFARIAAVNSRDDMTRMAMTRLLELRSSGPSASSDPLKAEAYRFLHSGAWYTMVVNGIDPNGPASWMAVVIFPESDFLAGLDRGYTIAVGILAVILALLFLIVIRLSLVVTAPLVQLARTLESFSGERLPEVGRSSKVREIRQLIGSFNAMNNKLHDTLALLNHEIAERTRSEQRLSAALDEREVLMRELNHRTKNNMAIISSMVQLQAAAIDNPVTVRALNELDGRIVSMALVHEKLYQSESVSRIDLADYFEDLIALLGAGVDIRSRSISIELDAEPIDVQIDSAVPCGLIVNELITNAVKHAFPGDASGAITVRLRAPEPGRLSVTVSDDGTGLPDGFDPRNQHSLGLQLVYAIVEQQLGGTVELVSAPGVRCTCEFAVR